MKKIMKLPTMAIMSVLMLSGGIFLSDDAQAAVTWYGPGFYGSHTASGEVYTGQDYTAAHPSLPFGTLVTVNGVTVRVNDRCSCELDLSEAAAEAAGVKGSGAVNASYSVSSYASSAAPAVSQELPKTGGAISYADAVSAGYVDGGKKH